MLELAPPPPQVPARLLPLPKSSRTSEAVFRAAVGVTAFRSIGGVALTALAAAVLGMAGWPAAIPWALAAGGAHFFGNIARYALSPSYVRKVHGEYGLPLHPVVAPEQVEPDELRASYLSILRTHEELRSILDEHEPVSAQLSALYRSCSDAVNLAGRTAMRAGPVRRFLDGRARGSIVDDIARLDALAERTADPEARAVYRLASATRRREADVHADIDAIYRRMKARIEVVAVTLTTAVAVSVHLCTLGIDQTASTQDALVEHISALDDDLRYLEDTATAELED